jgi:hypothetical protein
VVHQRLQRPEPALREIADVGLRHERRRPGPGRRELGPSRSSSVSALISIGWARGIAGSLPASRSGSGPAPSLLPPAPESAEIVEADLRRGKVSELGRGL